MGQPSPGSPCARACAGRGGGEGGRRGEGGGGGGFTIATSSIIILTVITTIILTTIINTVVILHARRTDRGPRAPAHAHWQPNLVQGLGALDGAPLAVAQGSACKGPGKLHQSLHPITKEPLEGRPCQLTEEELAEA